MEFRFTSDEVLKLAGPGKSAGQTREEISGIASLEEAGPGDLSFLGNKKYQAQVGQTKASIVLLPEDFPGAPPDGQLWLRVAKPSLALLQVCEEIERRLFPRPAPGIHPSAVVHETARLGEDVHIGPCVVVEKDAVIGDRTVILAHGYIGPHARVGTDCFFQPRATLAAYCEAGNRVRLQSGCVIGGDGFGYETIDGVHRRSPQVGRVVLADDVEIGANTTIDRARFDSTRVGEGTKVDNLVMLAHNVETGRGCLLVSQTGVSGSTKLGDYVVLGGQVGLVGHITVGSKSMVGAQSGLNHDLPAESYVRGSPARPYMTQQRLEICIKKLPDLFKRVAKVEELLEQSGSGAE